MTRTQSVALIGLMSATSALYAQQDAVVDSPINTSFYVAPMASYTKPSGKRGLGDGLGGALGLGYRDRFYALELAGIYSQFDSNGGGVKPTLKGGSLSGLLFPFPTLGAFLVGGGGYLQGEKSQASGAPSAVTFEAGLGYLQSFNIGSYQMGIRGDIRYRVNQNEGVNTAADDTQNYSDKVINLGLWLPLRVQKADAAPPGQEPSVAPAPANADTDGDGVPDAADQCPGTPPGSTVDEKGCVVATPAPPG